MKPLFHENAAIIKYDSKPLVLNNQPGGIVMFDFVDQLFHGHSDQKQTAYNVQYTPSPKRRRAIKKGGIAYDDGLISDLKRDHEVLIEKFGLTFIDGFESGDFTHLSKQLGEFKVLFQNHQLKENVKFFCYLEQLMTSKSKSLASVREFRKDINCWSNEVISFCKKYEQPIDALFLQDSFKDEYLKVGQALIHRIQAVENEMYSLYSPR